jgi:hypothetical protein
MRRAAIVLCVLWAGCAAPPSAPPAREVIYTPPHVAARRAAWDPELARYVNTGLRHPPVYFPSPTQDTQKIGNGEPTFFDTRREAAAAVGEPMIWAVDLALLPFRVIASPYCRTPVDYGPLDPAARIPPDRIIEKPDRFAVDK